MTEIAQTYLGNIYQNPDLAELVVIENCLEVHLNQEDRIKGRIHARTHTDIIVGIIKSRDRSLESGDVFKTQSDKLLLVRLQKQELLVLDFSTLKDDLIPAKLVYLGHLLGNTHHRIAIQNRKIYVQLTTKPQIIEKIIQNAQIPGLQIKYETNNAAKNIAFSSHNHGVAD